MAGRSGSAFTAPRAQNQRSWLYRRQPAVVTGAYAPYEQPHWKSGSAQGVDFPPDPLRWHPIAIPEQPLDFVDGLRTIVVNGFSKSYAMTGWRLGYAAGPAPLVKVMTKIHQSCIMSAPTTSQYAAITALRQCDDQIEMMRDEYNRRRRYVVKALNDMGLTCFEPRGAFYVFPSIQISGLTSSEFCEQLLREKEVAIIPGSAFGASGEGYARISYAYSVDHLQTAMKRIREFLTEHGWMKK